MTEFFALPFVLEARLYGLRVAVSGAAVCAVVLAVAWCLRKRSAPMRYGILFCGVLGLLTIPLLAGIGRALPVPPLWEEPAVKEEIIRLPVGMLPALLDAPPAPPEEAEGPPSLAIGIVALSALMLWIAGVAIGLLRLAMAIARQSRRVIGPLWTASFFTQEIQAQLAQALGLRRFPDVHCSPEAAMPMVVGLWRPVIVVPEQVPASWKQAQWHAILLHEGAHIARRDQWALLLQRIGIVFFWWCPLAHLLGRRLNALREDICDDYALQGPCDHIGYAEILIESAERMLSLKPEPVPLALLDSARGGLEGRVSRLLEKERCPMTQMTLSGRLLAFGFLVMACLLTTAATAFSGAQAQPAKKVQIKIIVDGKEIDVGDAKLLEHLEAAQKLGKGERVIVPLVGHGKENVFAMVVVQPPGKADPRIEELVKQAEAIKPGSGAEVRRALQGKAAPHVIGIAPIGAAPALPPMHGIQKLEKAIQAHVEMKDGKQIIILKMDDGTVKQLTEQDMKKFIDGGAFKFKIDIDVDKKAVETKTIRMEHAAPKATAGKELDEVRRQLERITAELHDLRKRLDAGKK